MVETIKITYRNSAYYVDRPNWDGGEVVPADDYALLALAAEVEQLREELRASEEGRSRAEAKMARLAVDRAEARAAVKVPEKPTLAMRIAYDEINNSLGIERFANFDLVWPAILSALTAQPAAPQEAEAVGSKRVKDAERIVRSFAEDRLKSNTQWALDPRYLITLCDAVTSSMQTNTAPKAQYKSEYEWREIIYDAWEKAVEYEADDLVVMHIAATIKRLVDCSGYKEVQPWTVRDNTEESDDLGPCFDVLLPTGEWRSCIAVDASDARDTIRDEWVAEQQRTNLYNPPVGYAEDVLKDKE